MYYNNDNYLDSLFDTGYEREPNEEDSCPVAEELAEQTANDRFEELFNRFTNSIKTACHAKL